MVAEVMPHESKLEQHDHKGSNHQCLIIVLSVAVIALAALQLLGIRENSINVCEPLIGVVLLLQAIYHWKKNRTVAIISLCAAGFIFACAIVILVLPLLR